jgi:hypothetical protein
MALVFLLLKIIDHTQLKINIYIGNGNIFAPYIDQYDKYRRDFSGYST